VFSVFPVFPVFALLFSVVFDDPLPGTEAFPSGLFAELLPDCCGDCLSIDICGGSVTIFTAFLRPAK
jgi:hypothetical protein